MSDDEKAAIIAAIRRLAADNDGLPVGKRRFVAETGFVSRNWEGRHWPTWSDAVREAGYEPNAMQDRRHSDDDLLRHLAVLSRKLGRFPAVSQMRMERRGNPDFPGDVVLSNRLGRKAAQIELLREFIDRTPEFADIAALLPESAARVIERIKDEDDGSQPVPEFVYLVRSGKHHKIGRSNHVGRRVYEIGLQLPERLEVVHAVETDDAIGIERYWHERFKDRRRNGEWFDLTKADIAAFKRRRSFM